MTAQHDTYNDYEGAGDIDWQRKPFPTNAEAQAFADGLTYGDEPKFYVDAIEQCRYPEVHGTPEAWDVVFCYADEGD